MRWPPATARRPADRLGSHRTRRLRLCTVGTDRADWSPRPDRADHLRTTEDWAMRSRTGAFALGLLAVLSIAVPPAAAQGPALQDLAPGTAFSPLPLEEAFREAE